MISSTLITLGAGTGIVLAFLFLPLGLSFPYMYDAVVRSMLELKDGTMMYGFWSGSDDIIPIYMDFHIFNWTNAAEFEANHSVVPHFEEVGPFVFKVKTVRAGLKFNDNRTVTFAPSRTYHFVPEKSLDLNSTMITSLSPVPTIVSYYSRLWSSEFWKIMINHETNIHEHFWVTESAGNWLFYGIEDALLDIITPFRPFTDLPIPIDKFAWFFDRNGSVNAEGVFNMGTGVGNLSDLGLLKLWQGSKQSFAYEGKCGEVGGTTGEVLPHFDTQPDFMSVFSSDTCSQVSLKYGDEVEVEGVRGLRYVAAERTFDNGSLYPEEACFCAGECQPTGARNVSLCKFGAPAFLTLPHFYNTDPYYDSLISGMNATKEKHEFYLTYEPTLSVPLEVHARLQLNFMIEHSDSFSMFKDMPRIFVPMMWFEERAIVTPELASLLNIAVFLNGNGLIILYTLAGIGFILLLVFGYLFVKQSGATTLTVTNELSFKT